jgi:hypothetical protein
VSADLRAAQDEEQIARVVRDRVLPALNELAADPALLSQAVARRASLPLHARIVLDRPMDTISSEEAARASRALLDSLLAGCIAPRKPGAIESVPPEMLADVGDGDTRALDGFVTGLTEGDTILSPAAVPWSAWTRTLTRFWIPLIVTFCTAITGLSLVIHRQWSDHEYLPYPTVEFARELLPAPGHILSRTLRTRLFWIGCGTVLVIHMNNYACVWWPEYGIPVKLRFAFWPLLNIVTVFHGSSPFMYNLFEPGLFFTVVGFAYFLATDVSFSLGIAPYFFAVVCGVALDYGVSLANPEHLRPTPNSFLYAGSYCGMFLVLAYTGRFYYLSVLRHALGLRSGERVESAAVWGARVFLAGVAGFVLQLTWVGLEWPFAVLYTLGAVVIVVVASRLLVEAGVFYLHAWFYPCVLVWGAMGQEAAGPANLLIMALLSSVLIIDPRETFMPFVVSGLRLVDRTGGPLGRTGSWGMVALCAGLAVAVPVTIYIQYWQGAIAVGDGWTTEVPRFALDAVSSVRDRLGAQGLLPGAEEMRGLERVANASPLRGCAIAFASTFGLVMLFTFLRHRFPWWPLHPVLFLVLGTWQSTFLGFSFLIGWGIKAAVMRYGGVGLYQRLKPLMVGVIAGEMLAGVVPMFVGFIYYFATGEVPKPFDVFR